MKKKTELSGNVIFEEVLKTNDYNYVSTFHMLYNIKNLKEEEAKEQCIKFGNSFFGSLQLQELAEIILIDPYFMRSILPKLKLSKFRKEYISTIIVMNIRFDDELVKLNTHFDHALEDLVFEMKTLRQTIDDLNREVTRTKNLQRKNMFGHY